MEYMVYTSKKVETHDLVGYKLQWGKLTGTIIDVIPAGEAYRRSYYKILW